MFQRWLFVILFSVFSSAFATSSPKGSFQNISINSREIKSEICKEMESFKTKHVREFFERAKEISGEDLNQYNVLDCHIKGTVILEKEKFNFDIQPIGFGKLVNSKTGKSRLLGCKTCDSIFPPKVD